MNQLPQSWANQEKHDTQENDSRKSEANSYTDWLMFVICEWRSWWGPLHCRDLWEDLEPFPIFILSDLIWSDHISWLRNISKLMSRVCLLFFFFRHGVKSGHQKKITIIRVDIIDQNSKPKWEWNNCCAMLVFSQGTLHFLIWNLYFIFTVVYNSYLDIIDYYCTC